MRFKNYDIRALVEWVAARRMKGEAKIEANRLLAPFVRPCATCRKEFFRAQRQRYCSTECKNRAGYILHRTSDKPYTPHGTR